MRRIGFVGLALFLGLALSPAFPKLATSSCTFMMLSSTSAGVVSHIGGVHGPTRMREPGRAQVLRRNPRSVAGKTETPLFGRPICEG